MKVMSVVMSAFVFLVVIALGWFVESRFERVEGSIGELSAKVGESECPFFGQSREDLVEVREHNCGGVVSEDLSLSDWERQYKVRSCFSDEWIYFDHKLECPNCGFLMPTFNQMLDDDDERTCQRCGAHLEAAGNRLTVTGRLWKGERYKEE